MSPTSVTSQRWAAEDWLRNGFLYLYTKVNGDEKVDDWEGAGKARAVSLPVIGKKGSDTDDSSEADESSDTISAGAREAIELVRAMQVSSRMSQ